MDIKLQINDQEINAEAGQMLIDVIDNNDISVPRFCYHKDLSIAANCRMCLVEVEGVPKMQTSCSTPVSNGMKVHTNNDKVKASQQAVMEFLLINHPLDCPICDQGGECELQDVAMNYGTSHSFFSEGKRVVTDSDIGPLITTDMTRCIHCTRCIRFGTEVAGIIEMGATGRGENMKVETFLEHGIESELSGNMIDICPVGALTSKPFRFAIRSWQMQNHQSIARHDLVGSSLSIQTHKNTVYRVSARENQEINQSWISDKDRFSYQSINSDKRLLDPKIKIEGMWQDVGWDVALDFAINGLKNTVINNKQQHKLAALSGAQSTLEELFLLKKLINKIGSNNTEYRLNIANLANYSYLDSTIKIKDLSSVDEILIIGANPRLSQVMINHRLRQATLGGAKVRVISTKKIDFNYPINEFIISEIDDFTNYIDNVELSKNSVIVLGEQINLANNVNKINQKVQIIADKFDAKILNISTSGNTIAARKIGFVANNVNDMSAYILLGIDSDFDLNKQLKQSVENADFVISLIDFLGVSQFSNVLLPIASLYESAGTFLNINETPQSFEPSVKPQQQAKPAWKVIKVLADMLELSGFNYTNNIDVTNDALIKSKIVDEIIDIDSQAKNLIIKQQNPYKTDIYLRNSPALQQTNIANNVENN